MWGGWVRQVPWVQLKGKSTSVSGSLLCLHLVSCTLQWCRQCVSWSARHSRNQVCRVVVEFNTARRKLNPFFATKFHIFWPPDMGWKGPPAPNGKFHCYSRELQFPEHPALYDTAQVPACCCSCMLPNEGDCPGILFAHYASVRTYQTLQAFSIFQHLKKIPTCLNLDHHLLLISAPKTLRHRY